MALRLVRYESINNRARDLHLRGVLASQKMLPDLRPRDSLFEPRLLLRVKPSEFEQGLEEKRVAYVAQGATNDRAGLGDIVVLAKRKRVAIGVSDQVITVEDMIRISVAHKFSA